MKDFEEEDFFSALLSTDFDTTDFDSFDSFDSSSDAFLRSSSESGGDDSPCLGVPLLCLERCTCWLYTTGLGAIQVPGHPSASQKSRIARTGAGLHSKLYMWTVQRCNILSKDQALAS